MFGENNTVSRYLRPHKKKSIFAAKFGRACVRVARTTTRLKTMAVNLDIDDRTRMGPSVSI